MPDAFAVTTPNLTITLDETRQPVPVPFAIENRSGHLVRVRGFAAPGPETPAAWLPVGGEAERDLPIGGSDEWVVSVTVPPDMPGGSYTFRFQAVSVTLPDEESGASEVVSIVVPELPEPPPPPPPPEAPGYLETVAGALTGAFIVAAVLGLIGLVMVLTANVTMSGSADTLEEILGELFANLVGLIVLAAILIGLFGGLGFWLGPPIGAAIVLKGRGFKSPWRTALAMVVLVPLIGLPIIFLSFRLIEATGMGGLFTIVLELLLIALAVTLAALAARAYARWRQTGGL